MQCCEYVKRAGPAFNNLFKRFGVLVEDVCVHGVERVRRKLVPKHACPCDLIHFDERYDSCPPTPPLRSSIKQEVAVMRGRGLSEADPDLQPWFLIVDRCQAELILDKARSGTFLVRYSRHGGPRNPFTLSLRYKGQVFHILIRKRPDGMLALGAEKTNEHYFASLVQLVTHYTGEKLQLRKNRRFAGKTCLVQWPRL